MIATVRKPSVDLDALVGRFPGALETETVDIADAGQVRGVHGRLSDRQLDVLFVNAGIARANDKTPGRDTPDCFGRWGSKTDIRGRVL